MKKLLTAMLIMVIMLSSFLACANNSTEDSSTDSVTSDIVTDSTADSVADVTSNTTNDSSDEEKSPEDLPKGESIFDFITYEDGGYFLTLPNTLTKIKITEYMQYIFRVDVEAIKTAEMKIIEQAPQEFKSSSFHIQEDEDGYLCLCREVIVELEPPVENGYIMGGCGYDHDHLFFNERLIDSSSDVIEEAKLISQTGNISSVEISTLPQGREYSFSGSDAEKIANYFSELYLIEDFPENPDEYAGMTYVVEIKYKNAQAVVVYLFSPFVKTSDSAWYKLAYGEYTYFDELLEKLNN